MAEEGTKREGTELLGLPPRKRFKVLEQQRRKEIQEEEALGSHCSDITNVMPQHRVSPKKLTSQGFLVLEKQKYKLQQQRLQENLAPAMPPLPPRPVAVKRKEAPALPLPTPPAMRLKFQGEKVHSPSSSAFKSWGSPSPKKVIKSEPAPVVSNSSPNPHKEQAQKPKRHQHGTVSAPPQPKTWTMAKGTTCSINKAQEDVEMLNSDISSSDDDVIVTTSTTSSLDLNVAAEGDTGVHVDNRAEASQDAEIVIILAPVPSTEDAIHDVENVAADLACSAPLEDISQAPVANTSVEAAHVEDPQANEDEEVVETAQVPTLNSPVEQTAGLSGGEESTVADVSEALVALQALGVAPESYALTPAVPETCASPLATDSTTIAVAESHTDSEASHTSNVVEDLTAAPVDNEEKTLPVPYDETCSARKDEETVVTDEVEVQEDKGAPLEVTEGGHEHETDMEHDGLLAELDERTEKLFRRMFEREGCDDEDDESDAQFFFASNGVNNFNSLVDMEVDQDLTRASAPEQKNGVGRGVDAPSLEEDHQVVLDRPTVHVPNKPLEKEEKPESLSRAAEDSDHESEPLIQETICKSSKEDSDWDLEMEVPDFGFGKRSGAMTQRVKAPGRWSQSAEDKSSNEADKEEDENEEGACDVCRNADAKPSDPIVYCDGCDIPVHADCYGAPLSIKIPEGDWFCAQCQSKRPDSRNCCLCPRSGGVMKMTTDGNWAHLSCAVFVPEVFFRNADDMEGIDTLHVPSKRYLAKCCVCKHRGGACVDCTEIGCKSSFHVSCALKKDLAMEFRNGRNGSIVISFCHEHTAAWDEQQERKGRSKYKIVSREPQKPKVFQRSKSR